MKDVLLKDRHIEDIEDVIPMIEESFGFKFADDELKDVGTFGELCDVVINKIQLDNSDDCTTQQAFYKLRVAIAKELQIDQSVIRVDTKLEEIFPVNIRREKIKQVEKQLGFKLAILRPRVFIPTSLIIICLASSIVLFFNWKIGLTGLVFSLGGIRIAYYFPNILDLKTVGDVADRMSRESYLKSRRNPSTVNRKEIEGKIRDLFSDQLGLPKTSLERGATFT